MARKAESFVSLTEAAIRLGVGYSVARDRLLRGELDGKRDGVHWVVNQASLEATLDDQPWRSTSRS